jgi:hypothetical protein
MSHCRFVLPLLLSGLIALPASAGIFSNKNAKQSPEERVSALILAVKTDKNEDKRVEAAHELRDFDPAKHQEIVPILIDVLQNDPKPAVRAEAAATLSKFRPVSQQVGMALDQATKDSSFRVRWQARSSLMSYRLAGYRSGPRMDEPVTMPQEAHAPSKSWNPFWSFGRHSANQPTPEGATYPQTETTTTKPWTQWFSFGKRPANQPAPSTTAIPWSGETPPPPLVQPDTRYTYPPRYSGQPQLVPSEAPKLQRPPSPAQSSDTGPELPSDK